MAHVYHLQECPVNSTPAPISGRFLSHNRFDVIGRSFIAADLHGGRTKLVKPTLVQAAILARVNRTYAYWAHKRTAERAAIESGRIPLVPAPLVPKTNGHVPSVPIPDSELIAFVRSIGIDRMLSATISAEAAE